MTLHLNFKDQLTAVNTVGQSTLCVSDGDREVRCEIAEHNPLAVSFTELRLTTGELADVTVADLQRLGEALAGRLTYLLEPISPIEADAASCTVQMRSNPPQKDDDGRSYYELEVRRGGEISLCRYLKPSGTSRESIPATVTSEVLVRLVSDFSDVLDELGG